jgi:hypothetical protein
MGIRTVQVKRITIMKLIMTITTAEIMTTMATMMETTMTMWAITTMNTMGR